MRAPALMLVVVLVQALVLACGPGGDIPPGSGTPGSGTPNPGTPDPRRVIALAPSAAELVFALGEGGRVVGVGDYVTFPPQAAALPRLGGLIDPHLEEIVALDPDLAILLPSEETTRSHLEALGIEVLTLESESLDDVAQGALRVAERLGVPEAGAAFVRRWNAAFELEKSRAPRSVREGVKTVLLSIGRTPGELATILSAGRGSFLSELLELLEVDNVMSESSLVYPQIGLEEVLARQPQVIVELQTVSPRSAEYAALEAALIEDWERLVELPAVAGDCVLVIAGEYVLVPGPRLAELYQQLKERLAECATRDSLRGADAIR